jgi:hypothetical protein
MTYDHDPESSPRGTSGSRTPLLGSSSHQRLSHEENKNKWTFVQVLQFFGGGIFVADPTTYDPLEILLNTEDEGERDELTTRWRDNKLSELSFVGVVVCNSFSFLGLPHVPGLSTDLPRSGVKLRTTATGQICVMKSIDTVSLIWNRPPFLQECSPQPEAGLTSYPMEQHPHGLYARRGTAASFYRCSAFSQRPIKPSACIDSPHTEMGLTTSAKCCPRPTASGGTLPRQVAEHQVYFKSSPGRCRSCF